MTQIVVTGGAGFIGTNLCLRLLEQGHGVIAVDNLITAHNQPAHSLTKYPNYRFVKHDITRPLPPLFSKQPARKYIYHLACPTGVPNIGKLGEEMLLTSSLGARNILELARKHRAKVVFTSSSEIYGQPEQSPQREDYAGNVDPVGYRSPYEEGKRFAESLITMYVRKYHVNAVIVRVFNTYGMYMASDDTRVIPRFIRQAIGGRPLTVHGDGTQNRTFCFVDDVVGGLLLAMGKGKKGEVYNIGGRKQYPIITLAQTIIGLTKSRSAVSYTKRPDHDHQTRLPDLYKISRLGWRPKTSLTKGLRKTIRWYPNDGGVI